MRPPEKDLFNGLLGFQPANELVFETSFKSRVVWPTCLASQELLEFVEDPRRLTQRSKRSAAASAQPFGVPNPSNARRTRPRLNAAT